MVEKTGSVQPGRLASELQALLASCEAGGESANEALKERVRSENPIDLARALSDLDREESGLIFDLLDDESLGVVLAEADPEVQAYLLMHAGDRRASLVSGLEPDDAADVLENLEESEREELLDSLSVEDAREIRELADHEGDTAGGLMTPEFVEFPPTATVEEVLARLRGVDAETINTLYVSAYGHLVGVFSIRDLLRAEPGAEVSSFMTSEVISVRVEEDQEQVVRLMETYHLSVLPVLDGDGSLCGIITHDDCLTAMEQEADEDVMLIAGAPTDSLIQQTVVDRVRARIPWLMITLSGGSIAAVVIQTLGHSMVSPVGRFLPIIGGMGGSVAMQSAVVLVRGFATGEIDEIRLRRLIVDEVLVGALMGLICGTGAGCIAWLLTPGPRAESIAGAVALSLLVASTLAAGAGTVIPTLSRRLGIDPAITSGPFITTLNDILGFTIFMLIATALVGSVV